MIKSELVQHISTQNPHLYQRDVENIVNAILNEIIAEMERGDRVELPLPRHLSEIGAARINDRWIHQHVDAGGFAGGKRALERRLQFGRLLH